MKFNILTFLITFLVLIILTISTFLGFIEVGPNPNINNNGVLAATDGERYINTAQNGDYLLTVTEPATVQTYTPQDTISIKVDLTKQNNPEEVRAFTIVYSGAPGRVEENIFDTANGHLDYSKKPIQVGRDEPGEYQVSVHALDDRNNLLAGPVNIPFIISAADDQLTTQDVANTAKDVCTGLKSVNPSAFFCQSDPKWGGTNAPGAAGPGCTLAYAGCGPTTAAMILARTGYAKFPMQNDWGGLNLNNLDGEDMKGQEVNPLTVDHLFVAGGWRPAYPGYCGSDFDGFISWLTKIDYTAKPVGISMNDIAQALEDGYTLAVSDKRFGGHLFGISGADLVSNKLTLFDPVQCATGGDVTVDYSTFLGGEIKWIQGVKNNGS